MELLTLEKVLEQFFICEKKQLESFYPGLTLKRLELDLSDFLIDRGYSYSSLKSAYALGKFQNVINLFFKQLRSGRPLQYITSRAHFFESVFYVDERVLIPRPETELLMEMALVEIKQRSSIRLAEVGVGSGAIALSLLKASPIAISADLGDLSRDAIEVAKFNHFQLRICNKHQLQWIVGDRLNEHQGEYDLILSNPPYIKENDDLAGVHHQVHAYEPHLALYLKDAVYDNWFEEFFKQVNNHLAVSGIFLMEGHENHLQNLAKIALQVGLKNVEIIKDYSGRDRFLKAKK